MIKLSYKNKVYCHRGKLRHHLVLMDLPSLKKLADDKESDKEIIESEGNLFKTYHPHFL